MRYFRSIAVGLGMLGMVAVSPTVFAESVESADTADVFVDTSPTPPTYDQGKVIEVFEEAESNEFGIPMFVQQLHVEIVSGEQKGKEVSVPYEVDLSQQKTRALRAGDRVVLGTYPNQTPTEYYISDVYRLRSLMWLLVCFLLVAIVFARMHAIRATLGLALSFVVIGWFILPRILAGDSPVAVSLIGAAGIALVSLYLAHGVKTRTTIAFVSTVVTAIMGVVFASVSVRMTSLFGIGSEEAFFLQFSSAEPINLQGLLLGGIIIGMLGVLDDVTTAQAATVEEIHHADPTLPFRELYRRGISVGREHITSLVNTLILAYTGAALPLLLLFSIYETPFWVTLNSEIVMEEIVRMIAGSMALILAVPLTTWLAAWWYGRSTDHIRTQTDEQKKIV